MDNQQIQLKQQNKKNFTEVIRLSPDANSFVRNGENLRRQMLSNLSSISIGQIDQNIEDADNDGQFEDFVPQQKIELKKYKENIPIQKEIGENAMLSQRELLYNYNIYLYKKFNNTFYNKNSHNSIDKAKNIGSNRQVLCQNKCESNTQNRRSRKEDNSQHQNLKKKKLNSTWKKQALVILMLIGKFIVVMKNFSQSLKFKMLKKNQFILINDRSSSYSQIQKKLHQNISKNRGQSYLIKYFLQSIVLLVFSSPIVNILRKKFNILFLIINPESLIKYIWDLLILLFLIVYCFFISLEITFLEYFQTDEERQNYQIISIQHLAILILILDLLINCKTAYYDKGILILQKKKILKNYLTNRFILDLTTIIFFFIAEHYNLPDLRLILLLRIGQIGQILNNYAEIFSLKDINAAIFDLTKLILLILFIGHFCACGFFYLHRIEKYYGGQEYKTWIDILEIPMNLFDAYITCIYWAVITMITVGYGDITPKNTIERCFVVIVTFISCGVFAYTVNSIGSIISKLAKKNKQFKMKMSQLTDFMKKRGLKIELQMKVKKYFQYLHVEKDNDSQIQEMIMQELASELKNEVFRDIYGRILKSKKIFSLNFSDSFLNKLALLLRELKFGPEDLIYKEKQQVDCIFFLIKGEVQLVTGMLDQKGEGQTIVKNISKGETFGDLEFFTGIPAWSSVQSKNVVTVAMLSSKSFLECIHEFPEDFEKYCMMRDNYIIYGCQRGLGLKCGSCNSYQHQTLNCPFVQHIPFKEQILKKFIQCQNQHQERSQQVRQNGKFLHSWFNLDILKETAIDFNVNNYEHINQDVESLLKAIENINQAHQKKDKIGSSNTSNMLSGEYISSKQQIEGQQTKISNQSTGLDIRNQEKRTSIVVQSELSAGSDEQPSSIAPLQNIRNTTKRRSFIFSNERRLSLKQSIINQRDSKTIQSKMNTNFDELLSLIESNSNNIASSPKFYKGFASQQQSNSLEKIKELDEEEGIKLTKELQLTPKQEQDENSNNSFRQLEEVLEVKQSIFSQQPQQKFPSSQSISQQEDSSQAKNSSSHNIIIEDSQIGQQQQYSKQTQQWAELLPQSQQKYYCFSQEQYQKQKMANAQVDVPSMSTSKELQTSVQKVNNKSNQNNIFLNELDWMSDQLREYKIYYPQNNFTRVIDQFQKRLQLYLASTIINKGDRSKRMFDEMYEKWKNKSSKSRRHKLEIRKSSKYCKPFVLIESTSFANQE